MKLRIRTILLRVAIVAAAGGCAGIGMSTSSNDTNSKDIKARAPKNWSIGILRGQTLLSLKESSLCPNPRITRVDITEPRSEFVADPFLIQHEGRWYLFFESFNAETQRGEIGWAESNDLCNWSYRGIALRADVHLSYPYVFQHNGEMYMVPESRQARAIQLYRAIRFPDQWQHERIVVRGEYSDASLARYKGRWWIFANQAPYGLAIFSAKTLRGEFVQHPRSPLYVGDASRARPAGRLLTINAMLYRFVQDNTEGYGRRVRLLRVAELTPKTFREQIVEPDPFLKGGGVGWNGFGMHHVSAERLPDGTWVAAVDGNARHNADARFLNHEAPAPPR
jgi:hypothetical protein